jgi:hypothetical protein
MDAALLTAGITAALAAAGYAGSRSAGSAPRRVPGRQGRRVQSRPSLGIQGFQPTNRADLSIRPPNPFNMPRRIPPNVAAKIAWDTVKIDSQITVSATAVSETNYSFNLSQHPQQTSWSSLFDQWSIPQVSISFQSTLPPGSTTGPCLFHTALDFDNTTAINTVAAIEDFSSCNSVAMQPSTRFVRSVKPSCRGASVSGGSQVSAIMMGPQWIDSALPGVNFYGIRSIASSAGASYGIDVTITIWYCFRNQI